jgi:molecular chaperone DnaK
MTSVATGAALYASTIDIGVPPPPPPEGTIALDLKYESATVETDALINLKINSKETSFILPEIVYAVLERGDKSYSSNKTQISNTKATLIEVLLNKNEANYFTIILTDEKGNKIPCQPNNLTITDIHIPDAPLPYNMGIEVWDEKRKIKIFKGFKGLEKNKSLKNAVGLMDGIKTPFELIPGRVDQVLRFPLYQGDDEAINKNSFQSNHVTDVIITGENIEKVLPANSDIEITLTFNGSGAIPICSIYFPIIQHTEKIKLGKVEQPQVDTDWLQGEIKSDMERVDTLLELNSNPEIEKSRQDLICLKYDFKNVEGSEEGKMKILNNIRKNRTVLDEFESSIEWSESKKEMKSSYFKAEELIDKIKKDGLGADLNMQKIEARLEDFKNKIEDIIRIKDVQMAKEIIEAIDGFILSVVSGIMPDDGLLEKNFIDYTNENFSTLKWTNPTKAREFINQGITNINNNGSLQQLKQLCSKISDLIDRTDPKQPKDIPTI